MFMKLKIKELREEYGLTQRELAEKINNVQRNVSNWEKGASEPDCDTILQIAELFGVSLDELFGRQENYVPQTEEYRSLSILIHRLNKEQAEALKSFLKAMSD